MKYTYTNNKKAIEGDSVEYSIAGRRGKGKLVFTQSGPVIDTYPHFHIKQGRHGTVKSFQILLHPDLKGCLARTGVDWSQDYPVQVNDFVNKSQT